ncbi:MAG: hypothetical protein VZR00_05410 [Lachnospiraceae bacterium]|jgi:hypothetical protein|nr:hypothetical protein [Lachnospiraceae bacterium]MEE3461315.1 hypothetical protein [Lachnospiraceae bacterium]
MRSYLLYRDKRINFGKDVPELTLSEKDLMMDIIYRKSADGDEEVYNTVRTVFSIPLENELQAVYRQDILKDLLRSDWAFKLLDSFRGRIYHIKKENSNYGLLWEHPESRVSVGRDMILFYVSLLKELKKAFKANAGYISSEGLLALKERIENELTDEFFSSVKKISEGLLFKNGIYAGLDLKRGLKSRDHILLDDSLIKEKKGIFGLIPGKIDVYSSKKIKQYSRRGIDKENREQKEFLMELREKSLNSLGNTLMQISAHLDNFFDDLIHELEFYLAAAHLMQFTEKHGVLMTFPVSNAVNNYDDGLKAGLLPATQASSANAGNIRVSDQEYRIEGLIDLSLLIEKDSSVVTNDLTAPADKKGAHEEYDDNEKDRSPFSSPMVVITGANQGGKTTFLRGLGQSMKLSSVGMPVNASSWYGKLTGAVFTHFRHEEDKKLISGKLDEELSRVEMIVNSIRPGDRVLFNESFASTNESEGSEIAYDIIKGMREAGISVFMVTHFYILAELIRKEMPDTVFLSAERNEDGSRTYKIRPGLATRTGFGMDIYDEIFD